MNDRLGFLSATGIVIAAVALVGVLGWTIARGPVLFSPGPLNSASKAQQLGGVTTHAQLTACGACHTAAWSGQTMADKCLACHTDVATQIQAGSGLHGRIVGKASSPTCRGCHTEHRGPTGALTVADKTFPHDLTGYSLRGHRRTARGAKVGCADCHPKGLAAFDQATCSTCHAAINPGFMRQHESEFGTNCVVCHDGSGRSLADFDHNKLAFKLTGKHAGVACGQCHSNATSLLALQSAPRDCYACHAKNDQHRGAFGQQCAQCHSTDSWANAKFDHRVFPVNHGNSERTATCQTCHPTNTSTYTCFGCHAHTPTNVVGEHEGRSAAQLTDCIRCHQGGRKGD